MVNPIFAAVPLLNDLIGKRLPSIFGGEGGGTGNFPAIFPALGNQSFLTQKLLGPDGNNPGAGGLLRDALNFTGLPNPATGENDFGLFGKGLADRSEGPISPGSALIASSILGGAGGIQGTAASSGGNAVVDGINGNGFSFQGLLANPLFNVGTGLLSAGLNPNTQGFGDALGQGLQFGTQQQAAATRNQFARERILAAKAQREAQAKRQQAIGKLQERLQGDDTQGPVSRSELLGLLTDIAPAAAAQGLLGQLLPKERAPTSLQRDFPFVRDQLIAQGMSPEEASKKALETLKRGTTVNVGKGDQPLSVSGPSFRSELKSETSSLPVAFPKPLMSPVDRRQTCCLSDSSATRSSAISVEPPKRESAYISA